MPSVSTKQHNLMEAVAHNPGFAKKVGIPQKVGKHFHEADKMKGKKFAMGGPAAPGTQAGGPGAAMLMSGAPIPTGGLMPGFSGSMAGRGPGGPNALPGMRPPMMRPGMDRGRMHMKKGGHVKPNELKGKAKETKSIAAAEMKALKRGHAPKEVMEHEKAEHKAMGYKKGGHVETPKKGFAMAETKGGRKPPHSHKGEEGDTKLKGFGMGRGEGKGRKVTKAEKPKDETKTKGFAMKKGGHVKHHAKGGAAKAAHKPKPKGKINPAALAAMMGPPGGAPPMGGAPDMGGGAPPMGGGAPPMGGAPGMKKGGHISHHHHHHYAKGGHVKKEPESGPYMVRKVHKAAEKPHRKEDGVAQRGHTRGKEVRMASGGHVGSHPSRRADGVAERGHTTCKIR